MNLQTLLNDINYEAHLVYFKSKCTTNANVNSEEQKLHLYLIRAKVEFPKQIFVFTFQTATVNLSRIAGCYGHFKLKTYPNP